MKKIFLVLAAILIPVMAKAQTPFWGNTVFSNYQMTNTDRGILVDTTSGPVTVTLPQIQSSLYPDNIMVEKKSSDTNSVVVLAGTNQTIVGVTNSLINQYSFIGFKGLATLSQWIITNRDSGLFPTSTPTGTPVNTNTPTATLTPTITSTSTNTLTPTNTSTPTVTSTPKSSVYGPGNPQPSSSLGVTGCLFDINPDASTGTVNTLVTTMPDISGNGYPQGATIVSSGTVSLVNPYGNHYFYQGNAQTGTTGMAAVTINFPSAMATTLNSVSVYEVFMPFQCLTNYWWMLGNTSNPYLQWTNYSGTAGLFYGQVYGSVTASRVNSSLTMPSGMSFFGVANGAVSTVISVNNQIYDSITNLPATVFAGGSIWDDNGNSQQGQPGWLARFLVYNHQLSDIELSTLKAGLQSQNYYPGFLLQPAYVCAQMGDSIPGHNTANGKPYETVMTEKLNFPCVAYDVATSGVTLGYIQKAGVSVVGPIFNTVTGNRFIVLEGGTNDVLLNSPTQAQVLQEASTVCAWYRNTYNCPIFFDNIIPGNSNNAATITAINNLFASAVSGLVALHCADAVVTVGTDTRITRSADNTHPTAAGEQFYGEDNAYAINKYFFTYNGTGASVPRGFPITFNGSGTAGPITDYSAFAMANPNVQVFFNTDGLVTPESASVSMIGGAGSVSIFNFKSSNATSSSVANVVITP